MKKLISLFIVVALVLSTSGCWDLRELDVIGLVLLVGIDNDEKGDGFEVTVHVQKPIPINGGEGNGGGGMDDIWVATARGQTVMDAFRNLRGRAAFMLSFHHTGIIVVGEDLARKGILPVLDFAGRTREIRLNTLLMVAKGSAKEFLQTKPLAANTLHEEIEAALANEMDWSKSVSKQVFRFVQDYLDPGTQPVASRVFTIKPEVIEPLAEGTQNNGGEESAIIAQGAAVFNDGQLVDWLTGTETLGYRYMTGIGGEAILVVPWHSGRASLEVNYGDCSKKLLSGGDIPHIHVTINLTATVREYTGYSDLSDQELLEELQSLAADVLKDIVKSTDKKAKDLGVDFLGYGGVLARRHPRYWSEVNQKWREIFPTMKTSFDVRLQLLNTGTISEPLHR